MFYRFYQRVITFVTFCLPSEQCILFKMRYIPKRKNLLMEERIFSVGVGFLMKWDDMTWDFTSFNSISVISRQWVVDNKKLCEMDPVYD